VLTILGVVRTPDEVRLKVERTAFDSRLRELISQGENLHVYGVGPQPESNRTFRRQFLAWVDEVERTLEWGTSGADIAITLQTPRLLSILEDRIPDEELYRSLDAEVRSKIATLASLQDEQSPSEIAASPSGPRAMTTVPPRVFVSHASEDTDRFVIEFCRRLRSSGIDAWLDHWELQPGDSLVDRIFEEGIGGANAFLVVLSKNSVDKSGFARS